MRWIATVSWIFDDVLRACCECGAVSSAVMRATTALACRSSRRCFAGTLGRPRMFFRSLTTGGPSSLDPSAAKWRVTEKVLHGGAATMARVRATLTGACVTPRRVGNSLTLRQ